MISIIICSVSPENLNRTKKNIVDTIGVEHEIIAIDNREKHWPLAKAYNFGANIAKYDYLLFVHEDVLFYTEGWGTIIIKKLSEPDCGVIGFAGSQIKTRAYSGWNTNMIRYEISNYRYLDENSCERHYRKGQFEDGYGRVVDIDGLAMFVRRSVWRKYPFDEKILTGFHCYDIDFSLELAKHYKNYVCGIIDVLHLSNGSFDKMWIGSTVLLHEKKWNAFLPLSVIPLSDKELHQVERRALYGFMRTTYKKGQTYGICTLFADKKYSFWGKFYITVKYINSIRLYQWRKLKKFLNQMIHKYFNLSSAA